MRKTAPKKSTRKITPKKTAPKSSKRSHESVAFTFRRIIIVGALAVALIAIILIPGKASLLQSVAGIRTTAVATTEIYKSPAGLTTATDYNMSVNGANTFVYAPTTVATAGMGKFAYYSFGGGSTHMIINSNVDVRTVDIRPKKLNITPKITGRKIEFDLAAPANISVEVNGNLANPLFLFANPLETNKLATTTGMKVISFAAGRVYKPGDAPLPANGHLVVPSNTIVYIPGGTVVKGKITVGATSASGTGASNVRIIGTGVLDSTALADPGRPLRINNSQNVTVDGPILLGKEAWGLAMHNSSDVTIKNTKVINWRETTTGTPDGIDIVASKNITLDGIFVRSYDDSIALKSGANGYANADIENITIQNATIWNGEAGNALEIGWETNNTSFKNITYKNIDIIHKRSRATDKNNRAPIAIHVVDGATVSNVRYEDIRIEDAQENYINFRVIKNSSSKTTTIGKIDNIYLKNVRVTGGATGLPSILAGQDSTHLVSNVTFDNFNLFGKTILNPQQANMTLTNTSTIKFIQSAF